MQEYPFWCLCVFGFSSAHALPVHSWNYWGNKQTSVDMGSESSKKGLSLCRKCHLCPVLLWPGLGLTNVVAGFVVAAVSVCVLNSKVKFYLNNSRSLVIKANEQVNNSIIEKELFANKSPFICPARDDTANLNKTSQNKSKHTEWGSQGSRYHLESQLFSQPEEAQRCCQTGEVHRWAMGSSLGIVEVASELFHLWPAFALCAAGVLFQVSGTSVCRSQACRCWHGDSAPCARATNPSTGLSVWVSSRGDVPAWNSPRDTSSAWPVAVIPCAGSKGRVPGLWLDSGLASAELAMGACPEAEGTAISRATWHKRQSCSFGEWCTQCPLTKAGFHVHKMQNDSKSRRCSLSL